MVGQLQRGTWLVLVAERGAAVDGHNVASMNGYTQIGLDLRLRFAAWLGLLKLQQIAG